MRLKFAGYCYLINWMLLRSSYQLRDFRLTMSHKLETLRSKNYNLVIEHLWPIDSVDLAVIIREKHIRLLIKAYFFG